MIEQHEDPITTNTREDTEIICTVNPKQAQPIHAIANVDSDR